MDPILLIALNVFDFLSLVGSGFVNLFIFIVNLLDLTKNKSLCVTDQLIFGISGINLLFTVLKSVDFVLFVWRDEIINSNHVHRFVMIVILVLFCCNLWLCTLLCLHFCLKLVNVKQEIYVFLQRRFHVMFPWIFLPVILVSVLMSIPIFLYVSEKHNLNTTQTAINFVERKRSIDIFISYNTMISLGYLLSLLSALMILISLYRHIKRMNQGSRSPNLSVHINAAKTVSCLLTANSISFACIFLLSFYMGSTFYRYVASVLFLILIFFSSLNTVKANSKLSKKLKETFERLHLSARE